MALPFFYLLFTLLPVVNDGESTEQPEVAGPVIKDRKARKDKIWHSGIRHYIRQSVSVC